MNLFNKYRPARFADIDQPQVTRVLKAQIASNEPHSTYMLSGPSGTGKTTTARVLAMALSCENIGADQEPCGACDPCVLTREDRNRDVIEENCADNNGVDDVREMIANKMRIAPSVGTRRIFILDECHMLTTQAQNALLKILEEPPPYVTFILATTDPQKVKDTILSRCQIHKFRRVPGAGVKAILSQVAASEGVAATNDGLEMIVEAAEGSARVALQILDQVRLVGATEDVVREVLGRGPKQMAVDLLIAIGLQDNFQAYQMIDTAQIEGRDINSLLEESARILMNDIVRLRLGKVDPKTIENPGIRRIFSLYNSPQIIDATQQLLDITKNIRQNVPAETVTKLGVLKIIARMSKLANPA